MRQEVYVWQRAWTQPVRNAVSEHATNFAGIVVLAAEISWNAAQPQLTRVKLHYEALANAGRPIGIALRIGPYGGPFTASQSQAGRQPFSPSDGERDGVRNPHDETPPVRAMAVESAVAHISNYLGDAAASLVAEAQLNRVPPAELQIDFDCAESKLDGYRLWVEAIQKRIAPVPVTITALPSWLDARAFKRLAAVATNYVLQVHSVERPKTADAPFTLCDPLAAIRAVERAGRIGVPFRVALPTYGYLMAFEPAGKFIGLSAEGPRPNWPTNAIVREVGANAVELSALVRDWTRTRPANMTGVIWYRLPVAVDNFNWRWPTLGAIVNSRVPREQLRAGARRVEAGLVEIDLVNEGELDISSRLAVEVRWKQARLVAGDGQQGFKLAEQRASAASFQSQSDNRRLRAGEVSTIGWLRLDRECEVKCEIKKL